MTSMQDTRDHALIGASPYVVICRDLIGAKYIPLDTLTIFFVGLIKEKKQLQLRNDALHRFTRFSLEQLCSGFALLFAGNN